MITITNSSNIKEGGLLRFKGDKNLLFHRKKISDTIFFKNKKYIIISARVHPSEVGSSYVLQGIINYLFSKKVQKSG